jgi:hypothetical protein
MKIEITINSSKYVVERESFDAETAFDDFLNLLFISGVEVEELQKIINLSLKKTVKENHKKDELKNLPNTCNL